MRGFIEKNLFDKNSNISSVKLRNIKTNYPTKYKELIQRTDFLPNSVSLIQRMYYVYHNIQSEYKCRICNNKVNFINFQKGFNQFCSVKCAYQDTKTLQKRQKTNLRRYGEKNIGAYGTNSFKRKLLNKYENQYYNNREKAKRTCLNRHGVRWPQQSKEIREVTKQNNFEKYGVEHVFQYEPHKQKYKQTCIEKYGVENPSQLELIKKLKSDKIKHTCVDKYGVEHVSQKNLKNIENLTQSFIQENFVNREGYILTEEMQKYFNISKSHSHTLTRRLSIQGKYPRTTYGEKEIYNHLLTQINPEQIKLNDRTTISPLELDFNLPDFNLAIEFNGLFGHSEESGKDITYHLKKTEKCEQERVQLLHIFENEGNEKQEIGKSIINNYLHLNKTVYARNCKIKEINNTEFKSFMQLNHLQGHVNASVKIGLYNENELVSCMSFGKPRYNNKYDGELLRFCNKKFLAVIGGANRIFKFFTDKYNGSVISYSNRKIGSGEMYKKIGFSHIGNTIPNYFYFRRDKVLSRIQCQKHKLCDLLEKYDSRLTEYQNMCNNGYSRIFDCGSKTFEHITN